MNTVSCAGTYRWIERGLDAREPVASREAIFNELPLDFKAISSCSEEALADIIELIRDCGEALSEGGDAGVCAFVSRKRYEASDQPWEVAATHPHCFLDEQIITTDAGKPFHSFESTNDQIERCSRTEGNFVSGASQSRQG